MSFSLLTDCLVRLVSKMARYVSSGMLVFVVILLRLLEVSYSKVLTEISIYWLVKYMITTQILQTSAKANPQGGHSPGKPAKVREFQSGQGKVRETEICFLDFERAEELKLQLLAACGPGLWICSSLTLL